MNKAGTKTKNRMKNKPAHPCNNCGKAKRQRPKGKGQKARAKGKAQEKTRQPQEKTQQDNAKTQEKSTTRCKGSRKAASHKS
jgi:hypothetical protein